MRRPLLALASALSVLAAGVGPARAQTYRTYVYQEGHGLPSGVVHDLGQESSGRMWFATRAGLVSFDGDRWRTEHVLEGTGSPLSRLTIDGEDRVWATAHRLGSGLAWRDARGDWHREAVPSERASGGTALVVGLRPLGDGGGPGVWICTRGGLYRFEAPAEGDAEVDAEDGEVGVAHGRWHERAHPPELGQVDDFDVVGGRPLVGTSTGLWELAESGWRRVPLDTPSPSVTALAPTGEPDGSMWLLGEEWLALLEADGGLSRLHEHGVPAGMLPCVREESGNLPAVADGRRGLWFGNDTRLAHFDAAARRVRQQSVHTGFSGNGANALFRDLDGNTWVATQRGLTRVPSVRFTTFDMSSGLLSDEVSSLVEHPRGRLVLGQPGAVALLDLETETVRALPLPAANGAGEALVLDMTVDREGVVWLAAKHLGLMRLDEEGRLEAWGDGERTVSPQTVHCDARGRLWVGSEQGVFRIEGGELLPATELPVACNVRRILSLASGALAICTTTDGVWVEERGGWVRLRGDGARTATSTYAAWMDDGGRLLVGALDGLFVRRDDRLERFPTGRTEGELRDPVYSIGRASDGRLWFGTQRGVFAWDGRELERYGVHDGLPGLETNRAANLEDSRGAMWFGTVKGAARYSALDDVHHERPPVVDLVQLEVDGRLHTDFEALELAAEDNDPLFRFKAISFHDTGGLEYRSRLEGFDGAWLPTEHATEGLVRYSNLPPGRYRFAVQARIHDGPWSETRRTGTLRIAPPFWMTPWFLTLAALVTGALCAASWRWTREHRTARALRLEVDRRTAELLRSQKLESLGLLAGGVAHDFNNLLTAIMAHCELARAEASTSVGRHLTSIDLAAERGAMLTRALLGYARRQEVSPRVLPVDRHIVEMQTMLRPLIRAEIELRLVLGGDELSTYLDPGQLEQLVMNLVINASDAMPSGGRITISTSRVRPSEPVAVAHGETLPPGDWICVAVADTGVGMDERTCARLFDPFFTTKSGGRGTGLGLSTCHGIVKQNRGFIDFDTRTEGPEHGTTFRIFLPALVAPVPEVDDVPTPAPVGELLGARVLLAEDDGLVRPMLEQTLRRAGCEVLVGASGEEALAAARAQHGQIDLLITDVIMPGMSGPELRAHLLEEHPEVLTLFISGYTADELGEVRAVPTGGSNGRGRHGPAEDAGLLAKPFTPEELLEAVARVLASGGPHDLEPAAGRARPTAEAGALGSPGHEPRPRGGRA